MLARGCSPTRATCCAPASTPRSGRSTEVKKDALLVPQRAVQDMQGSHQVAVVGAGRHGRHPHGQGRPRVPGSLWIIEQGLKPGERVIVEGAPEGARRREGPAGAARAEPPPAGRAPVELGVGVRHVQVLHQSPDRRDGHLDPHGDRRRRRDGAAARSRSSRTSRRPRSSCTATYVGADALTVEQSVATPIEQQMSGVDNMIYMYSINANNGGQMHAARRLRRRHRLRTPTRSSRKMRYSQAAVAAAARRAATTASRSRSRRRARWRCSSLYSPKGTYDALFLTNYAYININDPMTRVPGIGQVHDLRRRPVRDAPLGRARHARQARHHGHRDHRARSRRRTP